MKFLFFMPLLVLAACQGDLNPNLTPVSDSKITKIGLNMAQYASPKILDIHTDTIYLEDISDEPATLQLYIDGKPLFARDGYIDSMGEYVSIYTHNADWHDKGNFELTQEYISLDDKNLVLKRKSIPIAFDAKYTKLYAKHKAKHNMLKNGFSLETEQQISWRYFDLILRNFYTPLRILTDNLKEKRYPKGINMPIQDIAKLPSAISAKVYNYAVAKKGEPFYDLLLGISAQFAQAAKEITLISDTNLERGQQRAYMILDKTYSDLFSDHYANMFVNELYIHFANTFNGRISSNGIYTYTRDKYYELSVDMSKIITSISEAFENGAYKDITPLQVPASDIPKGIYAQTPKNNPIDTIYLANQNNIKSIVVLSNKIPVGLLLCSKVYKNAAGRFFAEYIGGYDLPAGDYDLEIHTTQARQKSIKTIKANKSTANSLLMLAEEITGPVFDENQVNRSERDHLHGHRGDWFLESYAAYIQSLYKIAAADNTKEATEKLYSKILSDCAKVKQYAAAPSTIPTIELHTIAQRLDKLAQSLQPSNSNSIAPAQKLKNFEIALSDVALSRALTGENNIDQYEIYLSTTEFIRLHFQSAADLYDILLRHD